MSQKSDTLAIDSPFQRGAALDQRVSRPPPSYEAALHSGGRPRVVAKKKRRRAKKRVQADTLLPTPNNGAYYTLDELSDLTDRLCRMHRHFPASNPHWKRVKKGIEPSVQRHYQRLRMGRPPLPLEDDD